MKKLNWMSRLILLGGFLYLGSASAVMINFSPSSETVNAGDAFDVDVVISDLYDSGGSREIVSAFDLDVLYDPAVLNATAVTFGTSLGANTSIDYFDPLSDAWIDSILSAGRIDFTELSWLGNSELLALQPDDHFTLATLSFSALAEGTSTLIFDPATFPGIDVKGYDPFSPFDLDNTAGQGLVTVVAAVPEPASVILMMTGLLGLGMAQRKRIF